MTKLHRRQPGLTCSACEPFTKHHERIQKFRERCSLKHLYKNKLDKACFAHDTTYSDSKDSAKRIVSVKILKDKDHKIGYQRGLASMVNNVFENN